MKQNSLILRFNLSLPLAMAMAALVPTPSAEATDLYWDVNGTTAGFSTVAGGWNNSSNLFWNTDSTGGAGTLSAAPTSADDLFISQAATNTGTITLTGGQKYASSITFAANVGPTTNISGQSIIIGGTGAFSGIRQQSTGANNIWAGLQLNSGNTAFGFSNSSTGLLTIIGAVTGTATSGNVTQMLTIGSISSGSINISGIIADVTGSATKVALTVNNTSTGVTELTGVNTYTGGTTISAGTLSLGNGGNNGSISGNVANSGILAFNRSGNATYGGIVSGTGAVTKSSTNTLTLTGANSYDGTTTISAGSLNLQHATGLGSTAGGTSVTSGAALQLQGGITVGAEALTLNGTGSGTGALLNVSGNNTYGGAITRGADTTIGSTAGTLTLSGTMGGNFATTFTGAGNIISSGVISSTATTGITKTGSGTLTLSAANTFTGTTTVSAGKVALTNPLAMQFSAYNTAGSNGTTIGLDVSNALTSGNLTLGGLVGSVNLTGAFTAGFGSVTNLTLDLQSGRSHTYSGVVANGASGMTLAKNGAGFQTLSGNNTYTGGTAINGGMLALGSTGALGSSGTIAFGGGTLQHSASNTTDYSGRFSTAVSQQYSIDTNSQSVTLATALTSSGGTLTKSGLGMLTLTGTNTYTGPTTVSAGQLVVNGSSSSSAHTVGNGGTLGGTGTVGALVVQNGGTIAPGNSPGILNVAGDTTWLNGGNYNWELLDATGAAGTGWDQLAITGALDLASLTAGGFNVNVWSLSDALTSGNALNFDGSLSYSWPIATATGGITGFDAGDFTIFTTANNGTNGFTNSFTGSFSMSVTGNNLNLNYGPTPVPEPASAFTVLALFSSGVLSRRKRVVKH